MCFAVMLYPKLLPAVLLSIACHYRILKLRKCPFASLLFRCSMPDVAFADINDLAIGRYIPINACRV